jgi:DNA-binding transcriptional LysR family regulator
MIRYTLRQLEYFVAVVEAGSVARAAHALNVTQPTVSAGIAKLEDQLGVQLLVRQHAQGVSPTPEGRWLLAYARNLLEHAREIERQSEETAGPPRGTLELASYMTLAPAFLPGLISQFTRANPHAEVRIHEDMQGGLIEGLRAGRFHLALLYDVELPEDLAVTPLARFPAYALLPADHPLAGEERVSLKALAELPMILLDVPPSRTYFLGLMRAHGLEPRIAHSSPSLELVRGLVGQGLGFSLLVTRPPGDVTYEGKKLAIRPIAEVGEPGRIALARLEALRPTRLTTAFEAFASGFFRQKQQEIAPNA